MGCASAKSTPRNTEAILRMDQSELVKKIISTITELEKIKTEKMSIESTASMKLVDLPLEDVLGIKTQTNNFSKEALQKLFYSVNQIFTEANTLIFQVQTILAACRSKQLVVKHQVREVFEEFLELFQQITQDILKMPNQNFEANKATDQDNRLTKGNSVEILESQIFF